MICGFVKEDEGKLYYSGEDMADKTIKERSEKIGYVMQNPNQMICKPMIYDEVALGLRIRGVPEEEIEPKVDMALKICGLLPFKKWPVSALSFGQKKRVTIASVLVLEPQILILDEPTAGLDPEERVRFRNLLCELAQERIVILSTHIVGDIEATCENIAVLNQGTLLFSGTVTELLGEAEGKIFTAQVPRMELPMLKSQYTVTGMLMQGNEAQVRFAAESQPFASAKACPPNVEDAYMYLMQEKRGERGCC